MIDIIQKYPSYAATIVVALDCSIIAKHGAGPALVALSGFALVWSLGRLYGVHELGAKIRERSES